MMRIPRLRLLFVIGVAAAGIASADGRFDLGRPTAACRLVVQVPGWAGSRRAAKCTDGDPCDSDGGEDGSCGASVSLCLESGTAPGCGADVLTGMKLSSDPRLAGLSTAFEDMKEHMPADASEACTPVASLAVVKGRLAVGLQPSGKGPHKKLALVCKPARRKRGAVTFATIQQTILTATCATASCHGTAAAGGLSLSAGAAYANLVGAPASNPAAQAAGKLRVVPGDPDASFLIAKLVGQLTPAEGSPMPLVGAPLTPAQLDMLRRWIAGGASETAPF